MSSSVPIATGHRGRDLMTKERQRKYTNDSTNDLELFTSRCQECQKKRKRPMTQGVVIRTVLEKEFASRGQDDLSDKQFAPRNKYKWILVY